jgi:hypothetical protein
MMLMELSQAKSLLVGRGMAADFRGYVSSAHTHDSLLVGCYGHVYVYTFRKAQAITTAMYHHSGRYDFLTGLNVKLTGPVPSAF